MSKLQQMAEVHTNYITRKYRALTSSSETTTKTVPHLVKSTNSGSIPRRKRFPSLSLASFLVSTVCHRPRFANESKLPSSLKRFQMFDNQLLRWLYPEGKYRNSTSESENIRRKIVRETIIIIDAGYKTCQTSKKRRQNGTECLNINC